MRFFRETMEIRETKGETTVVNNNNGTNANDPLAKLRSPASFGNKNENALDKLRQPVSWGME